MYEVLRAQLRASGQLQITQIMNLTLLGPYIQEQILFLPEVNQGRDPLKEWQVRPVAAEAMWTKQRQLWRRVQIDSL